MVSSISLSLTFYPLSHLHSQLSIIVIIFIQETDSGIQQVICLKSECARE